MKPTASFSESRIAMLRDDPQLAAEYLEECLIEGNAELFKVALKHVADARLGGMSALSDATSLNRESLYKSLSGKGNPTFETLTKVLEAIGLRLSVAAKA